MLERLLDLVVVQCCDCNIEYGIPRQLYNHLLGEKDKRSTICPNGHAWHFVGKSDAQLLMQARERQHLAEQRALAAEQALREEKRKKPPAALPVPRSDECPVCHRRFVRLSTHQTRTGHRSELRLA